MHSTPYRPTIELNASSDVSMTRTPSRTTAPPIVNNYYVHDGKAQPFSVFHSPNVSLENLALSQQQPPQQQLQEQPLRRADSGSLARPPRRQNYKRLRDEPVVNPYDAHHQGQIVPLTDTDERSLHYGSIESSRRLKSSRLEPTEMSNMAKGVMSSMTELKKLQEQYVGLQRLIDETRVELQRSRDESERVKEIAARGVTDLRVEVAQLGKHIQLLEGRQSSLEQSVGEMKALQPLLDAVRGDVTGLRKEITQKTSAIAVLENTVETIRRNNSSNTTATITTAPVSANTTSSLFDKPNNNTAPSALPLPVAGDSKDVFGAPPKAANSAEPNSTNPFASLSTSAAANFKATGNSAGGMGGTNTFSFGSVAPTLQQPSENSAPAVSSVTASANVNNTNTSANSNPFSFGLAASTTVNAPANSNLDLPKQPEMGNPFSTGTAAPTVNNNNTQTSSSPNNNPFSFGGNANAAPPANVPMSFGSAPVSRSSSDVTNGTGFSFGGSTENKPAAPPSNPFGAPSSTAAEAAAAAPPQFGNNVSMFAQSFPNNLPFEPASRAKGDILGQRPKKLRRGY